MGSEGPVALLALASIPLGRIDQCHGRYASPLPSSSGWGGPARYQDRRREEYQRATQFLSGSPIRRSSLHLKAGHRTKSSLSKYLVDASADGSKRRVAGRSAISDDCISALCSNIGLDATRKHPGQLSPSDYGSSDRSARRISPSGKRERAGIAGATADSDQTVPSPNG
jgi:hypothetical protein